MARIKFVCSECCETYSPSSLSQESLDAAGTTNPVVALATLDEEDLICSNCADQDPDEEPSYGYQNLGYSGRFELEGLSLDPARLQAYRLNY